MNQPLKSAYQQCLDIARGHYENFPVASLVIPRHLRTPVAAIYAFARRADDIADEGNASTAIRIAELEKMHRDFNDAIGGNTPDDFLYIALQHTVHNHQLNPQYFHDLLDAFMQDISKTRYASFDEVLDYCRRSANPVGRLILQLFQQESEQNNHDSDLICSALQLINFMQDIQQDLAENDRVYLPLDEMRQADVTVEELRKQSQEPHVVRFVHTQVRRARQMMLDGAALGKRLGGRLGIEVRTIIHGGLYVCDALLTQDIYCRPRLMAVNRLGILSKAIFRI